MSQSASSTDNHHPLPGLDSRPLASSISSHTATHNRPGLLIRHALGDARRVPPVRHAVLLERARHAEARVLLLRAVQLVVPVGAEFAVAADGYHPLDAHAVSYLPNVGDVRVHCGNGAGAFVACNAIRPNMCLRIADEHCLIEGVVPNDLRIHHFEAEADPLEQ